MKYTEGWTRRHFLAQTARGVFAAGVIAPLWDVICDSASCEAAYPPELLSIEAYTKGKLKVGDVLDANNVELVKDLLDPINYRQIKSDGRLIDLVPTETDLNKLTYPPFLEATIRNRGVHTIGSDGNVYTRDGKPWIGGNPFPDPKSAEELLLCNALTWGRHDAEGDPMRQWNTDADGEIRYFYDFYVVHWRTVGRVVLEPKPYQPGFEKDLRIMATVMTAPQDIRGMTVLSTWSYDQHTFPASYMFAPTIKRVRSMSPTERFDPLLPGSTMLLSDVWMIGDPLLTWGNFKLVSKGPMLACVSQGAYGDKPGWEIPLCGGKNGKKYFRTRMELVPEVYVAQLDPVHYSNCPYSSKRVWYDARTLNPLTMVGYDKSGEPLHQHEINYGTFAPQGAAAGQVAAPPSWAWTHMHAMDMRSGKMSRVQLAPEVTGGFARLFEDTRLFTSYCSLDALRRLGR